MDHQHPRHPVPARQDADTPVTLDAHGFDPAEFEWRPVPRRPRADGWTPAVQQAFMQALAATGTVERACAHVNMSVGSAYRLRHAPGAESFAKAWADTVERAAERLLDVCFERAIDGWQEPVFDRDGIRIGSKQKFDHRLALAILRAYMPDRFRHATRDTRRPDEALPPPAPPLSEVTATLAPVTPAAPHRLAEPERMATMIDGARGRAEAEALYPRDEREPYRAPPVEPVAPAAAERRRARLERDRPADDAPVTAADPGPYRGNPDDPWYDEPATTREPRDRLSLASPSAPDADAAHIPAPAPRPRSSRHRRRRGA